MLRKLKTKIFSAMGIRKKSKKETKKKTKPGAMDDNSIKRRDKARKNQELMIKKINS